MRANLTAVGDDTLDSPTKRAPLKLSQVRQIFRLLAEVRRRGDDPQQWRPFMAKELLTLFNAELVISTEIYVQPTSEKGAWDVVDIGWGSDTTENTWRIESRNRETNPEAFELIIHPEKELAEDRVSVEPQRPLHRGSTFMMSNMPLPHINAVDQLGVHRAHGAGLFTDTDHRLLRLLHVELARFWRADVLAQTRDPASSLAPRLKQTVELLCDGKSEKEIAFKLGISPHTVHNYVKALHQRFNVSSRGELIAAATKSDKDFVPRLSVEVFPIAKKQSKDDEPAKR